MNDPTQHPSVCAPMTPAWRGMQNMLFRPFNLSVWVGLGFTAWLAHMGQSGGFQLDVPLEPDDIQAPQELIGSIIREYQGLLITLLSLFLVLMVALALVFAWIRCRGAFMFLDNAVRRQSRVAVPWTLSRGPGNALFRWTLGYIALSVLSLLIALIPLGVIAYQRTHGLTTWPLPMVLGISLPLILLWLLVVILVNLALRDFIVPIMARQGLSTRPAWGKLLALVGAYPLPFLGYALARGGLCILAGMAMLLGGCLTCCCLFIVLMIPVAWAVILLPWLLFLRLYSLEFLRQFGPDFDLWLSIMPPILPPSAPVAEIGLESQGSSEETS